MDTLETVAEICSWLLPFEALYQAGLDALTEDVGGVTGVIVQLGPFGGAQEGRTAPVGLGDRLPGAGRAGGARRLRPPRPLTRPVALLSSDR